MILVGYVVAALASARVTDTWTSAVGGSAVVLGLTAVFGLLPTVVELATRMGLALDGSWRAPSVLPFDLVRGDVAPWLLPLTALVVLAVLPQIRIGGDRFSLDQRHTAGVFVATLGVLPMLYGAGFWVSMMVLVIVAAILTERRRMVRAWFLTAAGLFALAGVAQWLDFAQAPRSIHGLVIVAIGSLGLVASQGLSTQRMSAIASDRGIGEGLSVTWVLAGLAMADSSPWPRGSAWRTTMSKQSSGTPFRRPQRSWFYGRADRGSSLLFIIGGVLLWAGMTWESRVNDVRTASRYVRGLR